MEICVLILHWIFCGNVYNKISRNKSMSMYICTYITYIFYNNDKTKVMTSTSSCSVKTNSTMLKRGTSLN